MPFAGLGLHFVIAAFFAIHAIRSGRNMYWLLILFSFPLIGSVVYFFAEYLPELRHTRGGRKLVASVRTALDPDRQLREASRDYEISPSAQNRARLADALLAKGQAKEAAEHFAICLKGLLSDDLDIQWGMARAQLQAGQGAMALKTAQSIATVNPAFHKDAISLLIARAMATGSDAAATRRAFEQAIESATGAQAYAWYVQWLLQMGDVAMAQQVKAQLDKISKHWPAHARDLNREWLKMINGAMREV